MSMGLFDDSPLASSAAADDDAQRPLADRLRPETLDRFAGQEHILGPGKPLRSQIERDQLTSIIIWGPPGVGKTPLVRIIARMTRSEYLHFTAVLSGDMDSNAARA